MKKLINIFSVLLTAIGSMYGQTTSENYIQTRTYLEPVTTSSTTAKQIQTVEYFDGLGRPKQVIEVKATPTGNDIVTPILYDSYGLQTKNYLPIPKNTTSNGSIYPQDPGSINFPVEDVTNFYQGEKTYSETIVEISPLKRVQQQKQVGNAWSTKPMNFKYETNTSVDAIKKYDVVTTWDPNNKIFSNSIPSIQNYQTSILYKYSVKDEDGNETISFKNKQGQIVLTRKIISPTEKADTYYIYNLYNQLVYVIPPLASTSTSLDTITLGKLCYQYVYDSQNRLVEKKLPGKGWEYMVYDKQNRLVLTQDAKLGANKQWLFSKYDKFGRPAYTGIHTSIENYNSGGRVAEQANVDAKGSNNTERTSFSIIISGLELNYTIASSYPSSFTTLLTINYYDYYPFDTPAATNTFSQNLLADNNLGSTVSTNGILLASYIKNIEDDEWTKTYSWYDTKGRNTATKNQYASGGYTTIDKKLDFSGAVLQTNTYHKRIANDPEKTIIETYEYDTKFRLLKHWHQISGSLQELLSDNTYNPLSQLINKKVGGVLGNPLQNIDYQYNIRGWLTKINDPQNLNGKLFGYEIKHNNPSNSLATPKYNGNISEVDWKTANGNVLKRYYYQYDGLDRLKDAIYEEPSMTLPPTNSYGESLTYDVNGNIKTLKRYSAAGATPMMIDDLNYNTYDGNQLISVNDITTNNIGYPSGGNPIDYDSNGNMTSHLDKGISHIDYNFLDLPLSVTFNSSSTFLGFKYRADGTKAQQVYTYVHPRSGALLSANTDYLDGFQYVSSALQFYPTSEGYYDFQYNRYVYQYKDQVGNIRVAYFRSLNGTATIDKETNYYPFGMEYFTFNSIIPSNINYNYGFQNQEKQAQTGWSSFKWRNYDPTMGRFFNVDRLSEKYPYQSHYNFSENRVVDGRELEGLEFIPIEFMLENTGIEPIGPILEPMQEFNPPFLEETGPTYGPYLIDELELTGSGPLEGGPAGLELPELPEIDKIIDDAIQDLNPEIPEEPMEGEFSQYEDITSSSRGKEAVRNKQTDLTKDEFGENLEKSGFDKTEKGNGKAIEYKKGDKSYMVRDSKNGQPTADYRSSPESKQAEMKIRLNP
jgi:RHS repeat-associated protein